MRRPLLILAVAGSAVIATVLPAFAASLSWLSPGAGAVVSAPVDIAVEVSRSVGEEVAGVTVRLSRDGDTTAPNTRTAELRCAETDGCNTVGSSKDRWGLVELAPDGGALATGPVCNGQYVLQALPDGAAGWSGIPVVLTDPSVAAVTHLTADGEPRAAHLSWTPPSSAGDLSLRVERRPEGASGWNAVATLSGTATSYSDQAVTAGTWEYRVVTTRGDGFVSGRPVAACTDTEPDHAAPSEFRTVVVAPGPTRTRTSSTDDGSTGSDSDGTAAGPSEQGGTTSPTADGSESESADDPAAGDGGTHDGTAAGSGSSGPRTRVAAPPPARRSSNTVSAPEIARPQHRETYYGEGDEYSDSLDYGDVDPMVTPSAEDGEVTAMGRWVPGGTETITTLRLDERQVLLPIATGLLLLALGLHVRRWMRSA